MGKKGKSTNKKQTKQRTAEYEDAPRPPKAAKGNKPPKYKHPQYWLNEEVNLQ